MQENEESPCHNNENGTTLMETLRMTFRKRDRNVNRFLWTVKACKNMVFLPYSSKYSETRVSLTDIDFRPSFCMACNRWLKRYSRFFVGF